MEDFMIELGMIFMLAGGLGFLACLVLVIIEKLGK
jgi:hypothetical protein